MAEEEFRDTQAQETPEEAATDELESLERELADVKVKAEANLAGWQRAQADFANLKRRSEQERDETVKSSNAGLMLKILPILDDFERAVASMPQDLDSNPWVDGIKLIERKLRSNLEAYGLSLIEASGQPFDPRFHEAVREEPGKAGIVIREMEKGYKLFDKVLRPSKVVVGSGGE